MKRKSVLRVAVEICCLHRLWVSSASVKTFTERSSHAQYSVKTQSFPSSSPLTFYQSCPFSVPQFPCVLSRKNQLLLKRCAERFNLEMFRQVVRLLEETYICELNKDHLDKSQGISVFKVPWVSHSWEAPYRLITVGYKCNKSFIPPPSSPVSLLWWCSR